MKILGITGVAGSGKTTLANMLANCGWHTTKFASPIKSMLTNLLKYQGLETSIVNRMLNGDLKEVPTTYLNGKTPRYAMQTLGTEWRELIDRNLWVDVWKRTLITYPSSSKIIIDDLRFHHEARAVRSVGGKIIRIEHPNNPLPKGTHISETEMAEIEVDLTIINNAHPEAMLNQLSTLVEYWK